MASIGSDEEPVDGFPTLRRRRDGSYRRLSGTEVVPAGADPVTGVLSKDVAIATTSEDVTARLFLPSTAAAGSTDKLPVVVYFHGGGFCAESAFSPKYHRHVAAVSARANAVCVSVNYRLAPENPLPAAYEDAWAALRWATTEPWLGAGADLARVFVAGDSAGGNIAHNAALRATEEGTAVEGLVAVHPFFWFGGSETGVDEAVADRAWRFIYPTAARGLGEPCVSPAARLGELRCRRVLVCTAEADPMREGGRLYWEALRRSGFGERAELLETKGEGHVFHLSRPDCAGAEEMMERLVAFIRGESLRC